MGKRGFQTWRRMCAMIRGKMRGDQLEKVKRFGRARVSGMSVALFYYCMHHFRV
jgi:hypothetical protein